MASSSSPPLPLFLQYYSSSLTKPSTKLVFTPRAFRLRAHSCRDEGMSSDIVEANLSVLKARILEVKMKEKLERCCRCEYGWNYSSNYDYKYKKKFDSSEFFYVLGLVFGTFGFTCLSGTFFLCLVSLIIHLNH